jgi:hypothetical protein
MKACPVVCNKITAESDDFYRTAGSHRQLYQGPIVRHFHHPLTVQMRLST